MAYDLQTRLARAENMMSAAAARRQLSRNSYKLGRLRNSRIARLGNGGCNDRYFNEFLMIIFSFFLTFSDGFVRIPRR